MGSSLVVAAPRAGEGGGRPLGDDKGPAGAPKGEIERGTKNGLRG